MIRIDSPRLRRMIASRLARGTGITIYGQLINMGLQLAAVPVLVTQWGLDNYGAWLLMFTIPQLLMMTDLGFIAASGNATTSAAAKGDQVGAARQFATLRGLTLLSGCLIAGLAVAIIEFGFPELFEFAGFVTGMHSTVLLCLLAVLGLLSQSNMVSLAGYRASDALALGGAIFHSFSLLEGVLGLIVAASGGDALAVALTYFSVRAAGSLVLALILRRHAPWLVTGGIGVDLALLRPLAWPALASLTIPAANAISIQGSIMVLSAVSGNAAVPAFTTVRTLSRVALQFVFAFNITSMPRFTVAEATGDHRRMDQLVLVNLIVLGALLLPAMALFLVIGRPFVGFWTQGAVIPSFPLLALLVAAMMFNGLWMTISNLMMATNRQSAFSYFWLAAAAASLGLGHVLVEQWGTSGMAAAILAADILMVVWVLTRARWLGIVKPRELQRLVRGELGKLSTAFRHRIEKP